jgi:hypothetical protein
VRDSGHARYQQILEEETGYEIVAYRELKAGSLLKRRRTGNMPGTCISGSCSPLVAFISVVTLD